MIISGNKFYTKQILLYKNEIPKLYAIKSKKRKPLVLKIDKGIETNLDQDTIQEATTNKNNNNIYINYNENNKCKTQNITRIYKNTIDTDKIYKPKEIDDSFSDLCPDNSNNENLCKNLSKNNFRKCYKNFKANIRKTLFFNRNNKEIIVDKGCEHQIINPNKYKIYKTPGNNSRISFIQQCQDANKKIPILVKDWNIGTIYFKKRNILPKIPLEKKCKKAAVSHKIIFQGCNKNNEIMNKNIKNENMRRLYNTLKAGHNIGQKKIIYSGLLKQKSIYLLNKAELNYNSS